MIKIMMALFFVITILFAPVMYTNSLKGNHYKEEGMMTRLILGNSLGNLGQPKATCIHQYISLDEETHLRCDIGKLSPLSSAGLIAHRDEEVANDFCGKPEAFP